MPAKTQHAKQTPMPKRRASSAPPAPLRPVQPVSHVQHMLATGQPVDVTNISQTSFRQFTSMHCRTPVKEVIAVKSDKGVVEVEKKTIVRLKEQIKNLN